MNRLNRLYRTAYECLEPGEEATIAFVDREVPSGKYRASVRLASRRTGKHAREIITYHDTERGAVQAATERGEEYPSRRGLLVLIVDDLED